MFTLRLCVVLHVLSLLSFFFSITLLSIFFFFFFFNDTATTEIYTLSLHDALPIFRAKGLLVPGTPVTMFPVLLPISNPIRSEEHTSELQSRVDLVCRLLLEKKKKKKKNNIQNRNHNSAY